MRSTWALLKYSFASTFRYGSNRMWPLTQPLLLAVPALLVAHWGQQAGTPGVFVERVGTSNYMAYMLLGAVYWNFVEVVWWIPLGLRAAMRAGTLESLLVTAIPRLGLFGAWAGARMLVVIPSLTVGVGLVAGFSRSPPGRDGGKRLSPLPFRWWGPAGSPSSCSD